jgi:hypothetical protein
VPVPDLADDVRAVPNVDVAADATADASRRSSARHAAPDARLVYVSVLNAVTGSSGDIPLSELSQANVQAAIQKLNDYWSAETNGAVTFALGGYETRSYIASSCDPDAISSKQATLAFGGRFNNYRWVGTNAHLLTLTQETTACGNQGFGTVGGHGGEIFDANGLSGAYGIPVLLHEFGHNLGFGHADVTSCTNGRQDSVIRDFGYSSAVCPTVAYGDFLDIMGFSVPSVTPHLSAIEKIQFGVFTGSFVDAASPTGSTVVLSSLNGATGIRAVRITDPLSGLIYVVEYRTAEGIDAASSEFTQSARCSAVANGYNLCMYGANPAVGSVRIMREVPFTGPNDIGFAGERTYTETTVLAVSPVTGPAKTLVPRVDVGSTFTSTNSGFTVRVDSASPATGASVTIGFPTHTAVTASLSATRKAKQTYGAKSASRVVLKAAFTAPDGSPIPVGAATFYDSGSAVASVPVVNGVAKLRLPATTAAGKHSYSVGYTANDLYNATRSAATKVTVAKAKAVTKLTFTKSTVRSSTKAKAKVVVKVSGISSPTGTLVVYVNGKKLKSYALTASKHGKLTITLPKITKLGKKSVYVKYRGNGNIAADNSVKKHLRIVR